MAREEIHELTAAYALHALDAVEEAEYEEHLRRCDSCRTELASFQDAAASLAYLGPAPEPAPELRERILAQARSERANVLPFRRRWVMPAAAGIAAAAALVALAVGLWAASLSSSLEREREARQERERALAVLAEANTERIPLEGATGVLAISDTREAALVVSELAPAPEGKTYEAWVIVNDEPRPAAVFDAQEGRTVVMLETPVPRDAVVAVTLERAGGAEAPTGLPLFEAEPA